MTGALPVGVCRFERSLSGFVRGSKLRQTPLFPYRGCRQKVEVCQGCSSQQQAADFLGVNVRTLERYTQSGKIGGRYELGKTRSVLVYDEEELRAFKATQETKTYKPAVDPTPTNPDRDEAALSKFVEVSQLHLFEGLNHKRGRVESNT